MSTSKEFQTQSNRGARVWNIGLWVVQVILALLFCMSGLMKLATPIADLSASLPWTSSVPVGFVRFIGFVDLAGGLGIVLPSLTRIQPRLTIFAALGLVVLQVFAFAFHTSRGEYSVLPMNIVLLLLSVLVLWGRSKKAPIAAR